jgi:hypothetical protein
VDVRLNRIHPLILKIVGFHLLPEPDTSTLLTKIDQDTRLDTSEILQRMLQLITTIAAPGPENISGQAFRMHTNRNSGFTLHLALDHREMLLGMLDIQVQGKIAKAGRQAGFDEILDH